MSSSEFFRIPVVSVRALSDQYNTVVRVDASVGDGYFEKLEIRFFQVMKTEEKTISDYLVTLECDDNLIELINALHEMQIEITAVKEQREAEGRARRQVD